MNFLKKIFHRRRERKPSTLTPEPLTIAGIAPAPITPEPDEAEQAAAALLESEAERRNHGKTESRKSVNPKIRKSVNPAKPPAYYQALAHRIREGREMEERACRRWLTYCEMTLSLLPRDGEGRAKAREAGAGGGSVRGESLPSREGLVGSLERGLYDRQDIAKRAGGDLFRRWQHCLAEVTIRLMNAPYNPPAGDNGNS